MRQDFTDFTGIYSCKRSRKFLLNWRVGGCLRGKSSSCKRVVCKRFMLTVISQLLFITITKFSNLIGYQLF